MSKQLEKCRAHAVANSDECNENVHHDQDGHVLKYDKPSNALKLCPHPECGRTEPFSTGQRLRRHFQQRDSVQSFVRCGSSAS